MTGTEVKLELATAAEGSNVTIKFYKDGAVSLSADSAEHFIYLYPLQVKKMKAALEISGDIQ